MLSLECLFVVGVLVKIEILVQVRIVRARVSPSERETGRKNYLQRLISAYMVPPLKGIPAAWECTSCCFIYHHEAGKSTPCLKDLVSKHRQRHHMPNWQLSDGDTEEFNNAGLW
ncbi:hypothetical protein TNCV_770841 [Trichonephila clavipes]|nr:hypothetical protein TNCV_770841 [Trichonephila clavipes]